MIDFAQPTALFGGSFDPLHEGHLQVARALLAARPEIKQFVFVPAAHSPGKQAPQAPPELRLAWLRLAAEPAGFLVWDSEILRAGESFTVNTLEEATRLGAHKSRLFLVLGADSYASLPLWKKPERIRELAQILVAARPGHPIALQRPGDREFAIATHPASSSVIRAQLATGGMPSEWLPATTRKLLLTQNPYAGKKE